MKLLFENWHQYLKEEEEGATYYWQTNGIWKGGLDVPVPQAIPRDSVVEGVFEEVRRTKFPDRPSRLNCVFLCDNLGGWAGKSFCRDEKENVYGDPIETYEVILQGDYKIFKTDAEYWTEAITRYKRGEINEEGLKSWAAAYWDPKNFINLGEILVDPPSATVIKGKYES